jgi:predicted transcriptional regulator
MSAVIKKRRGKTAKQLAEHFGITARTVRNHFAEPRDNFLDRAADRRRIAGEMRAAGASWDNIAAAVDGTTWAARSLVRRYAAEQKQETEQSHAA